MQWSRNIPRPGDILRIPVEHLYHFGIYAGENRVVQFGSADRLPCPQPELLRVQVTSLEDFCGGREPETAVFEPDDGTVFPAAQRIQRALSRVGEGNYDFMRNNCEHFVYECAFGRHMAPQTDGFVQLARRLPTANVYVAPLPFRWEGMNESLFPTERRREIEHQRNPRVRAQKYYVWKLLEYALKQSFGVSLQEAELHRKENGGWGCSLCSVSLSHTDGMVAAAVATSPVGVDVEKLELGRFNQRLARHILTPEEQEYAALLSPEQRPLFYAKAWTGKESLFKRKGDGIFVPDKVCSLRDTSSRIVLCGGKHYMLTAAFTPLRRIKWFTLGNAELSDIYPV